MAADDAVARERAAIAARLHDGPLQELTAALLLCESGLARVRADDAEGAALIERGIVALRGAADASRALLRELAGDA